MFVFDLADEGFFAAIDDLIKADVISAIDTAEGFHFEADSDRAFGDVDLAGAEDAFIAFVVHKQGFVLHGEDAFGSCGGPGGAAIVRSGEVGLIELFFPRQAVLGFGIEDDEGDGVLSCASVRGRNASGEGVIAFFQGFESVGEAGFGACGDGFAVASQFDLGGLSFTCGGIDLDGDIRRLFEFGKVVW